MIIRYWISRLLGHRRFRAVYPDGMRSTLMIYQDAKSYVNMFGGKVVLDKLAP